jgi:hypothetical protein
MNKICEMPVLASLLGGAFLATAASAAELTLYADQDFQGRPLSVVIDERQLGVRNFDDRASSVVIEGNAWVLCSGEDFRGKCVTLEPGRYASLQALGLDDEVTSVRRREPASVGIFSETGAAVAAAGRDATDVVLFTGDDYRGTSHTVASPQPDLSQQPLKGEAASAVIARGQWELCGEPGYRGTCVRLGPGKYSSLKNYGLARGAASVRRASESPHKAVPALEN